jgi:site-specific DNA-methyltransferase (adenine-specific)
MTCQLFHGDCVEIVPTFPPQSVDAIITDIPYGTTACKWDTIIPFRDLWRIVKHVLKPRGAFVTTANQPFTSALVMSNPKWFKYEWSWGKSLSAGFMHSKNMPLPSHENILVFSSAPIGHKSLLGDRRMSYNPQGVRLSRRKTTMPNKEGDSDHKLFRKSVKPITPHGENYPKSWIDFSNASNLERGLHPTQKPIALYEYLIKTYTNEGDTVLDICMGSGTTGIACMNTGRNFIGIEKDAAIFATAQKRITEAEQVL